MKPASMTVLAIALALSAGQARAADDPQLNLAYQDHIAYVATFSFPILIEKCSSLDPGYLQKAAPLYFRFINSHQDQIERGRLLTLAELAPDQTPKRYREDVVASRLSNLDTGTREEKLGMCERALGVLSGAKLPGEWPSRKPPAGGAR
ncbi:hypothetical protein SAMN05216569_0472 [Pseudoxanthomonas sp. CF125]|nr:hypothetical protein SAMN05216569_0472 [Pseudoxanthomonas sp. CF125]